MLLTDDDICQMIKPIGVRRKLICIRNVLNSVVNDSPENYYNSPSLQFSDACASTLSSESIVGTAELQDELQDEYKSKESSLAKAAMKCYFMQ